MSKFSVLILGSASASPTLDRNSTAQLVNINEQYFLVDCGEGTQLRLRKFNVKFQRLHHIFISHLHGDHYLGLIGLLQTMHLLGRTNELNVYGPPNLKKIIDNHLMYSQSTLKYPLVFHAINHDQSEIIFENDKVEISTIILKHRIACTGFKFKEKVKPRRINPTAIKAYNIPKHAINKLKKGEDYHPNEGETIKNNLLTFHPDPSFSYAFCSDTAYHPEIIEDIKEVDLLYHEATFTNEHQKRAKATYHSTAAQAGEIAKKANVKKLLIGHFSNRYKSLIPLLEEARENFANTELAKEGKEFEL